MKKKKLQCSVPTLLLAGVLCLTLAACGAKQSSDMLASDTDSAASAALPVKAMNAKRVDENPYMAKSDANIHHDGYNTAVSYTHLEAAKKLRKTDTDCLLVFTTTSTDHALEGFQVRALHYLVKPFTEADIDVLTDELLARIPQPDKYMELKVEGSEIHLRYQDIVYACLLYTSSEGFLRSSGVHPTKTQKRQSLPFYPLATQGFRNV